MVRSLYQAKAARQIFRAYKNSLRGDAKNIVMIAFDLLFLQGRDLRRVPLLDRKKALKEVISGTAIEYSEHFEMDGAELYQRAVVSKSQIRPTPEGAATTGSRRPAPIAKRWQ
jgi:ATP-dependent DNA ligase